MFARLAEGRSRGACAARRAQNGRNHAWGHIYNTDIISMPDKWEYPWFAAWDLAFHCIPLAISTPILPKTNCADGAGMVHASERTDPGVRMEF